MNGSSEMVALKRECEATEIPSGRKVTLFPGTEVRIMQALGGTFTVMTHMGQMASIAAKDADAIDKEIPEELKKLEEAKKTQTAEEAVWAQLKTCYDPEIPHNIVDLGLIYECLVEDLTPPAELGSDPSKSVGSDPKDKKVFIRMSLTAPGCGMGDWLRQDIRSKVLTIPHVKEVEVEVTFDPPWNPSMMSPALRRAMNM